jgi:menaquinone-dependent protoporphyrinogen oxidase
MSHVLIAYTTKHGSTREVAAAIAETLQQRGLSVELVPAEEVESLDSYDAVVLGAPLYMGRWERNARRFLKRHQNALHAKPTAVFALGPLSDKPEDRPGPMQQLEGALAKTPNVKPVSIGLFGGVIDSSTLRFPFNSMPEGDWRDWNAITAWSEQLVPLFAARTRVAS